MERLDTLNDKYNSLLERFEGNNDNNRAVIPSPPFTQSSQQTLPENVSTNVPSKSKETDDLILKVDTLEQRLNSNILIFSCSIVDDFANEDIKSKFLTHVKQVDENLSTEHFNSISVFGKNKKQLKITCYTVDIKNNILKKSHIERLENSYFNEFLTPKRHKIF